jgi:activator of 2-hydroxyglutaryl-CoA dehydratase/benzoyl-CoA reductase/2-hydroxyglutaryl-CoA dehydratase subunit BcrC/BadD/HgdB
MTTQKRTRISQQRESAFESLRSLKSDDKQPGRALTTVSGMQLASTRRLAARRAYLTRLAYRPETKIAAMSLITPPEICWAAGYTPFNWEMFASLLATHSSITEIVNKGSDPTPRCSFINALKGSFLSGLLPYPNVTLGSSAFCEGIGFMFEELTSKIRIPYTHINIPLYKTEATIKNVASQLKDAFEVMCLLNGMLVEEGHKKFREVMYLSSVAKNHYDNAYRLRQQHGPVNLGLEPLNWHYTFFSMWGTDTGVQICKQLEQDLLEHIHSGHERRGHIPLAIFSLFPYGRTEIWDKIVDAGAYSTFEGINYLGEYQPLDTERFDSYTNDDLFENLAISLMNTPMRGGNVYENAKKFMEEVKATGAKGIIIFSHEQCQMLAPRMTAAEHAASDAGLKVTVLNGDCILGMPSGPNGLRLGTFLKSLDDSKTAYSSSPSAPDTPVRKKSDKNRIGVDFGSGYSKFVVMDKKMNVINHGVVHSGIDYPVLLKEITSDLHESFEYDLAVTGVGGDNPRFGKLVQYQTTEIDALISVVRFHFRDKEPLLVVDIGTQDVKILYFSSMDENPWINTNKSCGAGTGMVLAQVLERWKKTAPDMTFSQLDELASQAKGKELINSTCGIFAITNVVSALVQSNDERKKNILKGLYDYIATQALKLLPQDLAYDCDMLLVGGLANHKSLRKIFREKGFTLLSVPDDIHPQNMVALGAALAL